VIPLFLPARAEAGRASGRRDSGKQFRYCSPLPGALIVKLVSKYRWRAFAVISLADHVGSDEEARELHKIASLWGRLASIGEKRLQAQQQYSRNALVTSLTFSGNVLTGRLLAGMGSQPDVVRAPTRITERNSFY
jgi:hypothetical protein